MNVPNFCFSILVVKKAQSDFYRPYFRRKFPENFCHFREISRNSRELSSQNARYLCLWEGCFKSKFYFSQFSSPERSANANFGNFIGAASTKKHCGTDFSLALSIWVCQCVTHVFRALFGQGLILHFGSIVGWKQHFGLILALSFVSTKLTISNALVLKWQV